MNPYSLILFFLASLLVGLGVTIVSKYQRSGSIRYFSAFLGSLALIALTQGLLLISDRTDTALLFTRLGYLSGVLTFSFLLAFSWYFPIPSKKGPDSILLYWLVPIAFFIPLILLSPSFIISVEVVRGSIKENVGNLYLLVPVFIVGYLIKTLFNLAGKMKYLQADDQRSVKLFIWALLAASFIGTFFDIILPSLGYIRAPFGIFFASVIFSLSAYIVAKK